MAPNPALKILPAVWLLWGISALWSQEVTGPVVVTREDLTVDVFSQTSSYENPIEITTYFDTLQLVAGGAIATKYSLDFQLPGSPLAFQNTQRGMILSFISTTIDCRYEKQYSEGHVERAYIRIHFLLTKPDVPTLILPSHPLCPGSQYRLQAESELAERYEYQASEPSLLIGGLLVIPDTWSSTESLRVRSRAANFHGASEWSAWREVSLSRRVGGLRMVAPLYVTAGALHTFRLEDDGSGKGNAILDSPGTTCLWQISPGSSGSSSGGSAIELALPPGYRVIECLVSNPDYCTDTTLRHHLVSVSESTLGLPEIAVMGTYARTDAPFPLYLRGIPGQQPDEWFLDNISIPLQDGLFMVDPAFLSAGKHHLRTFLQGVLSIEAWITIE